jgi:hypothetical protein
MDWPLILSAGSLASCLCFFIYFRSYLRRQAGPEVLLAEFREEVYKLIAEIDAATDKDALLVEERVRTLRNILEDVDKRVAVHIREMDRRRFQEEAYAELGKKRRIMDSFSNPKAGQRPGAYGPQGTAPAENAEALPVTNTNTGEAAALLNGQPAGPRIMAAERPIEPKPAPFAEQVAELSRAGLSSSLIAARLGVGIAEVELAIAISKGYP